MRARLDALNAELGPPKETFLIVVAHADFNIGSNAAFAQMFADRLKRKLGREFGDPLPLPFENIFLISVL